ncbi:MAG TPA: radical SAM protein [Bacteroidales bacterium]|jgi:wyosine [tRNA(Phe)-imidazoG37] synthetase (radical SAM superfamily)|nr:radical SAM protein [Bacteroidales bacterium]HNR40767.1 radical SAM protein [Bacteroidales bacterium]HQG76077.1 radical SAM protein [Bacteroidales bacterium]
MISFGPVPSRRLGKSLGINNIVYPKTCSYGCIYCQAGNTLKKTCIRESFYEPENIYDSVCKHLDTLRDNDYPDFLTFVSNGEPTLDVNLGRSINLLKKTGIPVAVLTNSSLLHIEPVREDLYLANWVSIKMDAGDIITWYMINRPARGLDFETILTGIKLFRNGFKGILCTESMIVRGINDFTENFYALAEIVKYVDPSTAYLSVPTRPPAERYVKPPEPEKLNEAWHIFDNLNINTELLTGYEGADTGFTGNVYEDILNITAVHPLREEAMLKLLENDNADLNVVRALINQHLIKPVLYEGKKYFIRDYH